MKIIQLISSMAEGGAENLVKEYATELKRNGHEIYVVSTDKRTSGKVYMELCSEGIKVINLKGNKFTVLLDWMMLLRKIKPDVIHGHLKVVRFMLFANAKTKLFYTFHSDLSRLIKLWGHGFVYEMQYLCFFRNMQIIALHNQMVFEAKKIFKTHNVCFLENCIDLEKYQLKDCDKRNLKKELNIPQDMFVVGHIGRFIDVKNHKRIIEIFGELYNRQPNSMLLLIGDGEELENIKRKVAETVYGTNVTFLGLRNDVARLLNIMDVFLMPSFIEGFPMTVIEAQAAGIKVITSKAIPPEAIRKETTMRISLEEDNKVWVDAMLGDVYSKERILFIGDCDVKIVVNKLIAMYMRGNI